jgi:S-formylglutathione hydrolase FrmB
MPLIHVNFKSQALNLQTSMNVILPLKKWQPGAQASLAPLPTLYLLHGLSDDHTIWQRFTAVERHAEKYHLAVVMPEVHRSFYADMAVGFKYWTFISEEVPYVARTLFGLSERREENFVAGLSMGGYGAFKLALSHPDRFAAAASLSGALDMATNALGPDPEWQEEVRRIFGDPAGVKNSPNDLFFLARKVARSKGPKPRLFQWCGRQDFLLKNNTRFAKHALKLGYDLNYCESDGDHTWRYWDEQIQNVLEWLNLQKI